MTVCDEVTSPILSEGVSQFAFQNERVSYFKEECTYVGDRPMMVLASVTVDHKDSLVCTDMIFVAI